MTFFTLVLALLADQLRPHYLGSVLQRWLPEDGDHESGKRVRFGPGSVLALVLGVGMASAVLYFLLWALHPVLAFLFNLLVLYLMIGIRYHGERFADIHLALRMGEMARARSLLESWRNGQNGQASARDVSRLSIEKLLLEGHRQIFGCAFWFIILPGPSGAVMYRLFSMFAQREREQGHDESQVCRLFDLIDWLPVRLTALAFAVVGNFEDALYCWRSQAARWADRSSAILLASAGGALGLKLGMAVPEEGATVDRSEFGVGEDADVDQMQSAVSLLWRALLVYLFLFALFSLVA